jgi:methylenetetrahydrofolate dehydrogenase (NADP+)/methenyltetrahydrofolate cyclohydrolase
VAVILDGKGLAAEIRKDLAVKTQALERERAITPGLAAVLVGQDPASKLYVGMKRRACEEVGIYSEEFSFPDGLKEKELLKLVQELNRDDRFHGILMQLPLPEGIDEDRILDAVSPEKDVDGLHPLNAGRLFIGRPLYYPCTPYGIIRLMEHYQVEFKGKSAVVLGRSNIVGRPVSAMLLHRHATVTVCHSRTPDLSQWTRQADILVVAVGRAELVTGDMVKEGVVVVDVGINRGEDKKLLGDVHFPSVSAKAAAISPVPGGVGPMTIAMLLCNTLEAAQRQP